MYFDTAYVAKFYLNEPGSPEVRYLADQASVIWSSAWTIAEFHSVLHRKIREGSLTPTDAWRTSIQFDTHVNQRLWRMLPVTDDLLRRTSRLLLAAPADVFLRSGDALQLTSAADVGETEIWTNDRHMLAAAPHFGLQGRSIY